MCCLGIIFNYAYLASDLNMLALVQHSEGLAGYQIRFKFADFVTAFKSLARYQIQMCVSVSYSIVRAWYQI